MSIRITAVRLSGGNLHEHISTLWWSNPADGSDGASDRATVVEWVDEGGDAFVQQPGTKRSEVGTVDPGHGRPKYLRTYADGVWDNNLLALPRR